MGGQRGRPRSEQARVAVLEAAGDLLLEGGLAAAHVEAIAGRAGVSKATIYKWWPNRGAVVLDGFLERVRHSLAIPEGLRTVAALEFQIGELVALFRDPRIGSALRGIASEAQSDPELARAVRERWLAPRRAVTTAVLTAGVAAGDLRPDLDVELVMDQLYGPLYFRLMFGHGPLPDDLAHRLVNQLLHGIGHQD
ncbi:TetR/AcrR family transcriptional regulator [uncultured Jatrophihabitans sp.]|uniref:TetR/AcrR family transcriptional regulator n=1 Tax=uncultured Jatrophihabitans sp. TaxID=1610747 RepID=UPI0035C9EDF9